MTIAQGTLRAAAAGPLGRAGDELLHPDSQLLVAVGYAALTRDGVPVYEAHRVALDEAWTVRDAERVASLEPNREWCIHLIGLRDERHYRRHPDGKWRLYQQGYGLS